MKSYLYYLTIVGFSLLFFSCQKKEDIGGPGSGQIELRIQAAVEDFSNNLVNGKMASNYSYTPGTEETIAFGEDHMLVAEVLPFSSDDGASSKLLTSNRKLAVTKDIDQGDVYRLLVYDNAGEFVTKRDYTRGNESDTEPLLLYRNTRYTFIAYSLNETIIADLGPLLYVGDTRNPSDEILESTSTLSNTSIWGRGNSDLLFYNESKTTPNNSNDFLQIKLAHKYNLLTTTIDVSESGYSIADLAASFSIKLNSVRFYFEGNPVRYTRTGSVSLGEFTYSAVGGVQKSIATSEPIIINEKSGESLLEITTLTIGNISQAGTITPFGAKGVTLVPGYKYNLSVKIIPNDSLYTVVGVDNNQNVYYPVARINGQVWMRYNLDADVENLDARNNEGTGVYDTPGEAIHGWYFQYGKPKGFLSGKATIVDGYTDNSNTFNHYGLPNGSADVWNAGTETNPQKGSEDPCPDGFRLPTKTEYLSLITNTIGSQVTSGNGDFSNAMKLTSKRKKSVILTFPTQGYVGEGTDSNGYSGPSSITGRGNSSYTKSSSYNNKGTSILNGGITYISLEYMLLQGLSSASIYTGPGGGKVSASTVGHAVRCIAEGANSKISLNDRVIDTNNGGSVGF